MLPRADLTSNIVNSGLSNRHSGLWQAATPKPSAKPPKSLALLASAVNSDQQDAGILELGQKFKVPVIFIDPQRTGGYLSEWAEQAYIERIERFHPS